jgi:uncharacterized protein
MLRPDPGSHQGRTIEGALVPSSRGVRTLRFGFWVDGMRFAQGTPLNVMELVLLITGFGVGALVGLTGMGSGSLITPFLIVVVGTAPTVAVGTNLIYGAVTKLVGGVVHVRQGTVDLRVTWRLALASVPAGLAAVAVVRLLPHVGVDADQAVRRALGVVLVLVAVVMLSRLLGWGAGLVSARWRAALQGHGTYAVGAAVGGVVGVTSVGSGTLLVPFLVAGFPLTPARVVGTDVLHGAVLMAATGLAYAQGGGVDWAMAAVLLVGAVPGVLLGSRIAPRLPVRMLRVSLASLVLISGLTLL